MSGAAIYHVDGLHDVGIGVGFTGDAILFTSHLRDDVHTRTTLRLNQIVGYAAVDQYAKDAAVLDLFLASGHIVRLKFDSTTDGFWQAYFDLTDKLDERMIA